MFGGRAGVRYRHVMMASLMILGCLSLQLLGEADDPLSILKKRDANRQAATQGGERKGGGVEDRDPQTSQQQRVHDLKGMTADAAKCEALSCVLTQEQVTASVRKGANYLLEQLKVILPAGGTVAPDVDQHIWRGFAGDQRVGVVALMVQALIEAGRMTDDPRLHPLSQDLAPAVAYLTTMRTQQTYSAAMQAAALALLPARTEYRRVLSRVRDDLAAGMRNDGGYGYSLIDKSQWDNSNTQFAALGMWSVAEAGVEVPLRFWKAQDAHWRLLQGPQGGWAYWEVVRDFKVDPDVVTVKQMPSLTAAGLASLYVVMDQLDTRPPSKGDLAIQIALARVENDFRENMDAMSESLYYMYGVQRAGAASGRKYLGRQDWYRRGAAALVLTQRADGAWLYAGELPGTSLAILFLSHGGAPVIFNTLEYGLPGQWDPEPRAAAKVTRWMGRTLERRLNWQVVSVQNPASEWLDAPILLISGRSDPGFSRTEIDKLKTYVQAGGMIVSMGDGVDGPFSLAMKKLADVVVDGKYQTRKLSTDHTLFRLSNKIENPPDLEGISNGVRELWIHSPVDLGSTWQQLSYHVGSHWQIAVNLMLYATGQENGGSRGRLDSVVVTKGGNGETAEMLTLARVRYNGNWNPEPQAWRRLGAVMARDGQRGLTLLDVEATKLNPRETPVAHITGTETLTLNDAEQAGIVKFLAEGGILVGDATGGNEAFIASFESLAQKITGQNMPEMEQPDSALFNANVGGEPGSAKLGEIQYRKPIAGPRKIADKNDVPEIRVWKMKNGEGSREGRILFSRMDITSGLLGTQTAGITGYRPETAERLAQNLMIYTNSLTQSKLPK